MAADLFEHPDQLPQEMQDLLENFEFEETYSCCERLLQECNKLGYTFEYYLTAEPYDLRPMTKKELRTFKQASL